VNDQKKKNLLPVILFPITAYLFVGTTLFFILYMIERSIETLGYYSDFPGINTFSPREWYDVHILLTAGFPLKWPVLLLWVLLVFLYAVIASI